MSNKMRWVYGDTKPVMASIASETVVEIGDLIFEVDGEAFPAGDQEDALTETENQRDFAAKFLGVAMQASPDGYADPIRVATAGVFECTAASGTYLLGDLVGVDEAGGGTALLDQTVAAVASEELAIGKVAKTTAASATKVLVEIMSTTMGQRVHPLNLGHYNDGGFTVPLIPDAAPQALSGAGAVNVTAFRTNYTSTGAAQALTLANGTAIGQLKEICHVVDGGSGVLTPTTLLGGTTITFTTVAECALLMWTALGWRVLRLWNTAVPGTPPVLA